MFVKQPLAEPVGVLISSPNRHVVVLVLLSIHLKRFCVLLFAGFFLCFFFIFLGFFLAFSGILGFLKYFIFNRFLCFCFVFLAIGANTRTLWVLLRIWDFRKCLYLCRSKYCICLDMIAHYVSRNDWLISFFPALTKKSHDMSYPSYLFVSVAGLFDTISSKLEWQLFICEEILNLSYFISLECKFVKCLKTVDNQTHW